ncbi:MAG: DUF4340 domain-containing protein [Planctomycetes bacterium]|nr:DUF4340 domain-containing protein [Planctomycetota bacterium]
MKSKNLLILIVVLAILAYFGLKEEKTQEGAVAISDPTPFSTLDLNSITKVKLIQGDDSLVVAKSDGLWRVATGELDFPVDFSKFKTFLRSIAETKLVERKTNSANHDSKFGLDADSKPVKAELYSGEKVVVNLNLGDVRKGKSQGGGQFGYSYAPDIGHYIKVGNDEGVFMAKEKIDAELRPASWMQNAIAKADKDDITKIDFVYPYKAFSLEKKVEIEKTTDPSATPKEITSWLASGDQPEGYALDSEKMSQLLDQLDEIRVSEPVKSSQAEAFKEGQFYGVKVSRGEESLYDIKIQQVGENWYVYQTDKPQEVYQISSYNVENVFGKSDDLFALAKTEVLSDLAELSYKSDKLDLSFKLEADKWSFAGKAPQPELKEDALNKVKDALKELKLMDFHPNYKGEQSGPELIVSDKNGKKVSIQKVGEVPLSDGIVLKIQGKSGVFSLSQSDFDTLFPPQSDLLALETGWKSEEDLTLLSFKDFELSKKDDKWAFKDGSAVKKDAVTSWVSALEALCASKYLASGKDFVVKTTAKVKGKEGDALKLEFSDANKGLAYARLPQFGGVFEVKWDLVKALFNGKEHFSEKNENVESAPK